MTQHPFDEHAEYQSPADITLTEYDYELWVKGYETQHAPDGEPIGEDLVYHRQVVALPRPGTLTAAKAWVARWMPGFRLAHARPWNPSEVF